MATNPFPISTATFSSAGYYYTELLSDGWNVLSRVGSIVIGKVWKRGQILKIDQTTSPPTLSLPAVETDCNCILAQDVDTTAAAGSGVVYVSGMFKVDAITWPPTGVHGVIDANLRGVGIFLESVVANTGVNAVPTGTKMSPEAAKADAIAKREAATKAEAAAKAAEAAAEQADADAKAAESAAKKAEADAPKEAGVRTGEPSPHHEAHSPKPGNKEKP